VVSKRTENGKGLRNPYKRNGEEKGKGKNLAVEMGGS